MPLSDKKTVQVFFELLKAGLWEKDVRLSRFGDIDFAAIMQLAEEQSVVGLITAGLEQVKDVKVPQVWTLQFIGSTLQIEQRNKAMNQFIEGLVGVLRKKGIYTLLVKGQGVAQCYERPLWRSSGDVDLFLTEENYTKAKSYLLEYGTLISHETEKNKERLNAEFQVGEWLVELHGTQHANLSKRMDREIDAIQDDIFAKGKVRVWRNGGTDVYLPAATEDITFVFAHILQHLFLGGIGLRQVCDWSRLLWTHRDSFDFVALKSYLRKMGVMSEWRVFGCIAVDTLGMSVEAMPFYDSSFKKKADKLLGYIVEVGNFGHNKDDGYLRKYSGLKRKIITFWKQMMDSMRLSRVFPLDAFRFLGRFFFNGVKEIL